TSIIPLSRSESTPSHSLRASDHSFLSASSMMLRLRRRARSLMRSPAANDNTLRPRVFTYVASFASTAMKPSDVTPPSSVADCAWSPCDYQRAISGRFTAEQFASRNWSREPNISFGTGTATPCTCLASGGSGLFCSEGVWANADMTRTSWINKQSCSADIYDLEACRKWFFGPYVSLHSLWRKLVVLEKNAPRREMMATVFIFD